MAAGVPVIATAHSGLADFVSDATANTIPTRSSQLRRISHARFDVG